MPEASIRFALSNPGVSTVLVGYSDIDHLGKSVQYASRGVLPSDAPCSIARNLGWICEITMNEILGNLDSLRSAMDTGEFDAIIAMSPENVPYTSGVGIWSQKVIRDRLALVVWPREGDPTLIVATNEEGYVKEKSWISDVRGYRQHADTPIKLLSDVLQEKGLSSGRIGFEPAYLTTDYYLELLETMPEAEFKSCEPMLQRVRMIKTDIEIDILSRGAMATERALMATYSTSRPGEKERDLVARLGANIMQAGAELPSFLFFTVGPNSGYAHPDPTDIELQPNDILKADCGGWFNGYFSDIGRTVVVGKATDEQHSIYNRLAEVHRKTIATMQCGVNANEVYRQNVEFYKEADIEFSLPFAGHGLGLYIHEMPMLAAYDDTPLAPNMVFAVETRVRWPGVQGFHIEDLVVIREEGPEIITTFMDTSRLLEL